MTRIVFCGGGTGGHVMPAIAVVETLRKRVHADAYLLGTGRRAELKLVDEFALTHIDLYGLQRSPRSHIRAIFAARRTLRRIRPDIVVGLGGYASIGGILAAKSLGIPTVLLEQNAVPGRATSLLSRVANKVCAGLPLEHARLAECPVVGTPVRSSVAKLASLATHRVAGCGEIFVLGGSQGSRFVSDAVLDELSVAPQVFSTNEFFHQTVEEDVDAVTERYADLGLKATVRSYFEDVPALLARGPLVVSRAGGTTLAELACAGVPSILIPHAAAFRDHQAVNACVAETANGAVVLSEDEVGRLGGVMAWLAETPMARVRLADGIRTLARPEAALAVAEEIMQSPLQRRSQQERAAA